MKKYSKKEMFEQALVLRDQIYAINTLEERQNIERRKDRELYRQ